MKILYALVFMLTLSGAGYAQKEVPPAGGQPKDFTLPKKQTIILDNGLQATLVPYGTIPKVAIRVTIRTGNIDEAAGETWLADLTGEFLKEGTATHSAQDIANRVASMGGDLNVNTGLDESFVSGEVLPEFAPDFITLAADIVQNAAFPESELNRLKNNMVRNLNVAKAQPNSLAQEKFFQVMYGNHPYGRLFPEESSLKALTINLVRSFHAAQYGAKRTHIYVVGQFDARSVEKSIRESFATWKPGNDPTVNIPKMSSSRSIYLIDRPGAPQSVVYIGLPAIDPSQADYVPFTVTNTVLGGSFGSRITSNIRENKGYTYSPFSSISNRYRCAHWAEVAAVTTAVTGPAIKEILFEINRLQTEVPSAGELDGFKNYQAGVFVLQNSSLNGITNQLSFLNLHGLPESYLTNYVKTIFSVTPDDISRLAKTYIQQDNLSIVIVGDIKQIKKQIEPFGKIVP